MNIDGLVEQARKATPGSLGEFIREQRESAQVSVRQLARLTGVSNPYLSQVERGLRKPSAEILQQIAHGLQISAEQLYARAGLIEAREGTPEVVAAIFADPALSERHKHVLVEIYQSLRRESAGSAAGAAPSRPAAKTPTTAPTTPTTPTKTPPDTAAPVSTRKTSTSASKTDKE